MIKAAKLIPLFLLAILLSACSTTKKKAVDPNIAVLSSNMIREGLMTWIRFDVEAVDNRSVTRKRTKLRPGVHNVVLVGSFNRGGFGAGPFKARGDVDMNFEPGRKYVAAGTVKGSKMLLWINDAETKQPVSEVLRIPYSDIPVSNTTFIPLYIPG